MKTTLGQQNWWTYKISVTHEGCQKALKTNASNEKQA